MTFEQQDSKFLKDVVESSNRFSTSLYKLISSEEENCFYSPISIYIALVLAHVGADGQTAEEFVEYLHLPENKADLLQGVRELIDLLEKPVLNMANEIFIEKSYKVKPEYIETVGKYMDSKSQLVDFKTASSAAEKLINDWVSTQTSQKINDLIPSGTLDEFTKLVLVNAIHFKDVWKHQFKGRDTTDSDFHVSKEKTIKVPMMYQREKFRYLAKDNFKLLRLPYKDSDFAMVLLLPNEIDGLKSLEDDLPSLNINELLSQSGFCDVMVKLPKFKMEKFVDLTKLLSKLGLQHMSSDAANFTGMFDQATEEPLKISKVLHKAFVEVNEEGTEAAAATGKLNVF